MVRLPPALLTALLAIGCDVTTDIPESACTGEQLSEMQALCLEYGGAYSGETSSSVEVECEVSLTASQESITGARGACHIVGDGDCRTDCSFPDGEDSGP